MPFWLKHLTKCCERKVCLYSGHWGFVLAFVSTRPRSTFYALVMLHSHNYHCQLAMSLLHVSFQCPAVIVITIIKLACCHVYHVAIIFDHAPILDLRRSVRLDSKSATFGARWSGLRCSKVRRSVRLSTHMAL